MVALSDKPDRNPRLCDGRRRWGRIMSELVDVVPVILGDEIGDYGRGLARIFRHGLLGLVCARRHDGGRGEQN